MDDTLDWYTSKVLTYILHTYTTHTYKQTTSELYNIYKQFNSYIDRNQETYLNKCLYIYIYTILIDAILTLKLILIEHLINLHKRP